MSFNPKEPFVVIFENGSPVIVQNNKKYTLNQVEIKEEKQDEPVTDKTTNPEDSRKKQPRSGK